MGTRVARVERYKYNRVRRPVSLTTIPFRARRNDVR